MLVAYAFSGMVCAIAYSSLQYIQGVLSMDKRCGQLTLMNMPEAGPINGKY